MEVGRDQPPEIDETGDQNDDRHLDDPFRLTLDRARELHRQWTLRLFQKFALERADAVLPGERAAQSDSRSENIARARARVNPSPAALPSLNNPRRLAEKTLLPTK